MTSFGHTYGPSCSLHTESSQASLRPSESSRDAPKIRAQFFYSSALPIDDPLSRVPPPSSNSATALARVPPRPFSVFDNIALEEAWQKNQKAREKKRQDPKPSLGFSSAEPLRHLGSNPDNKSNFAQNNEKVQSIRARSSSSHRFQGGRVRSHSHLPQSVPNATHHLVTAPLDGQDHGDLTLCDDPEHIPFDHAMPVSSDEDGNDEFEGGRSKRRRKSLFQRDNIGEHFKPNEGITPSKASVQKHKSKPGTIYGSSPSERDTTGTPFLRVASRLSRSRSRSRSARSAKPQQGISRNDGEGLKSEDERERPSTSRALYMRSWSYESDIEHSSHDPLHVTHDELNPTSVHKSEKTKVYTTVGVSRLHVVQMPDLKMGPIYWDPVHDISSVIRGTWFYKDTMMPVEPDVANRIEEGYEYIKPWTSTYFDELKICLEIGADAELKIVHKLWPVDESSEEVRPDTRRSNQTLLNKTADQLNSDERVRRRAIILAAKPENKAAGILEVKDQPRLYAKSSIIYANSRDAQILRPNLLPSVSRGRRPLTAIRKGRAVGIPVVRGFDHKSWEKIYPTSKKAVVAAKSREGQEALRPDPSDSARQEPCIACLAEQEKPKPTDLVLVIHGIGQKLSERVESYHFTHAINAFRRRVNVELDAMSVRPCLRKDFGGMMVLPASERDRLSISLANHDQINWRSTLKLEADGPDLELQGRDENTSKRPFTLKDITADSIPAIRNLISDVMLDIPYYLSHHKQKMVEAVTKEANRVYRLWCKNNPWFAGIGRVHIIAHSLGSVMALDILSSQPTKLPDQADLQSSKPRTDMFEFDTTNLFFCGSPAGLFLLLHRAPLLPRKGRDKAETDGEDIAGEVAGDAGTYGCLAVDNLYNIMHYNDPIAYRVNACVDADYAAALQPASVPSATYTWMQSLGSVFRSRTAIHAKSVPDELGDLPSRLAVMRLPSTLEMETHDFTREEIAEKRMFLMNENGQIDYTLHSGGGPLEIQYLNMLSAHSSYWILQDFVRFLVVEIGRKAGKSETLPAMKAIKKLRGKDKAS